MSYDALTAEALAAHLTTRRLGRPAYLFETISSTNAWLMERAQAGEAEGALAITDTQTAGKGRLGRAWQSPPGAGLLFSLLLRPPSPQLAGAAMMAAAVGVAAAVRETTGAPARLKWPNDVLLEGRKLAGLLAESSTNPATGETAVVIGIGLNANLQPDDFPPPPPGGTPATSLLAFLGHPVDRVALLHAILPAIEARYDALLAGQPPLAEWRSLLDTLGQPVTVMGVGQPVVGVAEGVAADGSLLVRRADGTLVTVAAGDVSLRAPAEGEG